MDVDYLIVGSGLSALVFGALSAKAGSKVIMLEAHQYPGGFGHTFPMGKHYKFNAQLHYVWNCGEGETVNKVLKKLELDKQVTFESFDPEGFDHMRMPGYQLDIPYDTDLLLARLWALFPDHVKQCTAFIDEVRRTADGLEVLSGDERYRNIFKNFSQTVTAFNNIRSTLQQVFDKHRLPLEAQTLLALQWPDFLLPPNQLSFCAWVLLFTGYQRGAYYPTLHFEHVINSLAKTIEDNGGQIVYKTHVEKFIVENNRVLGVEASDLNTQEAARYEAKCTICNMDPKKAAHLIGIEKFSLKLRRQLDYAYSPSNFMAYCSVKDINLQDYGFGRWNIFHTSNPDLNAAFDAMYNQHDYSAPSFAISTPGFLTDDHSDRPEGQQIIEFLTVADYQYFKDLKASDSRAYRKRKRGILDNIIDIVEDNYIPDFREYLAYKNTGSPTTNENFCWCPQGNSYGSAMTPGYFNLCRLNHNSSLKGLYFCNASSGYAGFAGTFWTGAKLYQNLTGERIL
ncbi:NAD(P)/FAD-dependent oxidoreductase [Shewanella canadensis]|uniref:NAD(P)/FAD-dependent oxidoreductase n=1 Tax=Shewanella canadensis TaxID=271096 RepID=A0A3S0J477_9GAMM|nr:NAD(P)/FAD-dependent oxidoreductase [Shewanella canadensis]RTR37617.1 NAD(P)/FAD-dependent oxidoreductase [Shewanella canadensis]